MCKLSVITINYNNAKGLKKTISSIKSQSLKDFEFIVIDGSSIDDSVDIIRQNEPIVDYWISEKDSGAYNAMNKGVQVASGEYCIFMNSGDVFYDDMVIEKVIPLLNCADIITGATWLSFGRLVVAPNDVTMRFLYKGTLCHQSSFIKRSLLLKYPYDEELKYVSDWKFWVQVLIFDKFTYKPIDPIISIYDWSGMSTINFESCDAEKVQELRKYFPVKVLQDYKKLVVGESWEDKLYIEMKESRYHKLFYKYNVLILKIMSFLKKDAKWMSKYPINQDKI